MTFSISDNLKTALLLTAPLIAGRNDPSSETLTPGEYKRLVKQLAALKREPADLLAAGSDDLIAECRSDIDADRLKRLLDRGYLLGQAVDRWQSRSIWILGQDDVSYPSRLKQRLKDDAPPVLYGCGEASKLDAGGLAIVGSRDSNDEVLESTREVGKLSARSEVPIISGGARGIDHAAMSGALDAGGCAVGVLAERLEQRTLLRSNRAFLMEGHLVFVSPYDPLAGFNVGHAMQRNKIIYALSDAALIMRSDVNKGGTWAGAIEQLSRLHFVNLYVPRHDPKVDPGLYELKQRGAKIWPDPDSPDALRSLLREPVESQESGEPVTQLGFAGINEPKSKYEP
jgi:DNA processing protein